MNDKLTVDQVSVGKDSSRLDAREFSDADLSSAVVETIQVDGQWIIYSRYGDDYWKLTDLPSNVPDSQRYLNFLKVPLEFQGTMKAIMFRYKRRGREGQRPAKGSTLVNFFRQTLPFLRHLESINIKCFSAITPSIMINYATKVRNTNKKDGTPRSQRSLLICYQTLEAIFELSQHTRNPIPEHPWPKSSAKFMAGLTGAGSGLARESTTPLIPDAIFCTLFENAHKKIKFGKHLLDLRDSIIRIDKEQKGNTSKVIEKKKNKFLSDVGWEGGLVKLNTSLNELRTACYIVIASTSGCRAHEICNLQTAAHHRTKDDDGTIYHWMRSKSEKTDTGEHDWMIPEIAVQTLRLMSRWAKPYQSMIAREIFERRKTNPLDPEIANSQKHRHALFLGIAYNDNNKVRTLSTKTINNLLKSFSAQSKVNWSLASHQFRRKFANYVAHSQFGDLRYLREHFAHWTMDMSLSYAMDESWGGHLDLDLYEDILAELKDIKIDAVRSWLSDDSLAGGNGRSLKKWQRDASNLAIFNNHQSMVITIAQSTSIRSNGHAWCTADNGGCVGNTMERTRCGDCDNAVIGQRHLDIYRQLYGNLVELLACNDIGESGRTRVLRDIERCRDVFNQLGYDPEEKSA
jgi:integrase